MKKIISGLIALLVIGFWGYIYLKDIQKNAKMFPAEIAVEVEAGTVTVVPYKRKTTSKIEINGPVDAQYRMTPEKLPQDITLRLREGWFIGGMASGYLLLNIPDTAQGTVVFTVSASARVFIPGVGNSIVYSEPCRVTLEIAPPNMNFVDRSPPDLAGEWTQVDWKEQRQKHPLKWEFSDELSKLIITDHGTKVSEFTIHFTPSNTGSWVLFLNNNEGNSVSWDKADRRVYYIEFQSDTIAAGWPGQKPFANMIQSD